jgi:hypothetical protein
MNLCFGCRPGFEQPRWSGRCWLGECWRSASSRPRRLRRGAVGPGRVRLGAFEIRLPPRQNTRRGPAVLHRGSARLVTRRVSGSAGAGSPDYKVRSGDRGHHPGPVDIKLPVPGPHTVSELPTSCPRSRPLTMLPSCYPRSQSLSALPSCYSGPRSCPSSRLPIRGPRACPSSRVRIRGPRACPRSRVRIQGPDPVQLPDPVRCPEMLSGVPRSCPRRSESVPQSADAVRSRGRCCCRTGLGGWG